MDTDNHFLNGETGTLLTDPSKVTYTNNVQNEWLVHPAFTSNAANGGGFGELEGLWVGKFEATGSSTGLSVKPGETNFVDGNINTQFRLAKTSKFGETVTINSHMAKNSEWGATAYLSHSKYGINGQNVEANTIKLINGGTTTGGSTTKKTIYTTNKKQSTTYNANGIYDMSGGNQEFIASYAYKEGISQMTNYGGAAEDDLFGASTTERTSSNRYKMVYPYTTAWNTSYRLAVNIKGDAYYETSTENGNWFSSFAQCPNHNVKCMFFTRGGSAGSANYAGLFEYNCTGGDRMDIDANYKSMRVVLAF